MSIERMTLDMAGEIRQFYKWIIDNSMTAREISLWHALMNIADEAGYPVWLSIPMSKLEKLTGAKKDAIYTARDKLETLGRIEIREGQGNQAPHYRLIPFLKTEEIDGILVLEVPEDPKGFIEMEVSEREEPTEQPPVDKPGEKVTIFRKTQQIIPMPPSADVSKLMNFMDEGMEEKLLCEAVDITMENEEMKQKKPMDRWHYFNGIIRNWYNNGIKTYSEYEQQEKEREERLKDGGTKQGNRNVRPETKPKSNSMREFRIPGE